MSPNPIPRICPSPLPFLLGQPRVHFLCLWACFCFECAFKVKDSYSQKGVGTERQTVGWFWQGHIPLGNSGGLPGLVLIRWFSYQLVYDSVSGKVETVIISWFDDVGFSISNSAWGLLSGHEQLKTILSTCQRCLDLHRHVNFKGPLFPHLER